MANEHVFSNRVSSYTKGRVGYADEVMDLLFHEIVKPSDKIADVGSGTGIFARAFIDRGFDVYCVEPNDHMRAQAKLDFGDNPHFISIAASAEDTTLPDHSVDLVTAASAFHWFDPDKFRIECMRILKPNGVFFYVANGRDYSDPFTIRQHEICVDLCLNFSSLRHGLDESMPYLERFFGSRMNHMEFDFPLEYTKEKFIQRSLSSSYAPELSSSAYQEYMKRLWKLLDEFAPNSAKIMIPNVTVACWGKLSD